MANTVICTYRVAPGQEEAFRGLLDKHWTTLERLNLTTPEPTQVYRGQDPEGRPFFVEIFTWISADAPRIAHESPEVVAIWEPMATLCEERDGRPAMEFPHVERVALTPA